MTKRLPDFSTSKVWNDLRQSMGATATVELPALGISQISLKELEILKTANLDIENIKDHIDPIDGTFNYKGQKVILYIKQQYRRLAEIENPRWEYKYHLSFCNTLFKMETEGRFKTRYVVTQRTDGQFLVDIIALETRRYVRENDLCSMNVCKYCLSQLNSHYPNESLFNYHAFDLDVFIKKYNTQHTQRPIYSPETLPKNEYTKDWEKISRKIRENAGYICSDCDQNFSNQKHKLHVHHVDGMKWNNSKSNLKVLCLECHSKQPGHNHINYHNTMNKNVRIAQ